MLAEGSVHDNDTGIPDLDSEEDDEQTGPKKPHFLAPSSRNFETLLGADKAQFRAEQEPDSGVTNTGKDTMLEDTLRYNILLFNRDGLLYRS